MHPPTCTQAHIYTNPIVRSPPPPIRSANHAPPVISASHGFLFTAQVGSLQKLRILFCLGAQFKEIPEVSNSALNWCEEYQEACSSAEQMEVELGVSRMLVSAKESRNRQEGRSVLVCSSEQVVSSE